jgi:hypothetical protein
VFICRPVFNCVRRSNHLPLICVLHEDKSNQKALCRIGMSTIREHKEKLRNEIAGLISETSYMKAQILSENNPENLQSFLQKIHALEEKTAALHCLLQIPEPKEPVIVPFIKEVPANEIPQPIPIEPQKPEIPVVKLFEPSIPVHKNSGPVSEPKKESIASSSKRADIRTLIGFNEKLMFVRNLFKGDGAAYDAALDQINQCESSTEAESFCSVLASEYHWDAKQEPVQVFSTLIKRRFS